MSSPALIAFDLDCTLWDFYIDAYIGPLRRDGNAINQIFDRDDEVIAFYKDVPAILHRLRAASIPIAACSRTQAIDLAHKALRLLLLPPPPADPNSKPIPAIDFFDDLEIYPGSKITHFKQLHKKTGIPYSKMLFFDDESRNKEVEGLGVTFQLVPGNGLSHKVFEQGLALWRTRHPEEASTLND